MILLDVHVHIYDRFDLDLFFNAAAENFSKGAEELGANEYTPIIFLADWSNINWFEKLKKITNPVDSAVDKNKKYSFKIRQTEETTALRVELNNGDYVYVMAGKKIITSENLEVLALCSSGEFSDGFSLRDTVNLIGEEGAIPIIPWAVGKWLGARGEALNDLMDDPGHTKFYLCDNGNRPSFWGWPQHFKKAEQLNIPILSGSDPLHFSSEADRTGRFGFGIDGNVSDQAPAKETYTYLKSFDVSPKRYGQLENPLRFVKNQILMQVFKKKWRKELLK